MARDRIELALVVPSNHTTQVDHLCHLFDDDRFRVQIYTTKAYIDDLEKEKKLFYRNHAVSTSESLKTFPALVESRLADINRSDLVLITTLYHHYRFWSSAEITAPVLLFLHNLKYWFDMGYRRSRPPLSPALPKWIANEVRQRTDARHRKRFLSRVEMVNLHTPRMLDFFHEHCPYPGKTVTLLPFAYRIGAPPDGTRKEGPVRFVIPGQIAKGRKNFDVIEGALERVGSRLKSPIEVHLLGNAEATNFSRETAQKFRSLATPNLEIVTYSSPRPLITGDQFNDTMRAADVLLGAHRKNSLKHFKGYDEEFGKTAFSGFSTDMIAFSKPAILPAWFRPLPALETAAEYYEDEETLARCIERFAVPSVSGEKAAQARSAAALFTKEKILDEFLETIGPALRS